MTGTGTLGRRVRLRAAGRFAAAVAAAGFANLWAGPAAAQSVTVDLELVLAVDTSSSVSTEEFDLQMIGLAEAFRDSRVITAIQASGDLGIAVALIQWSDYRKQVLAVDWHRVANEDDAYNLAAEIAAAPRFLVGGGTAVGGALEFSLRELAANGIEGRRQVIDVSGDGRTNQGAQPANLRDKAVAIGVTVNGLAILNEDPTLDSYYYSQVIGGTGAFVMTANDYEAYAQAILNKLIKEISGTPVAGDPGAVPEAKPGIEPETAPDLRPLRPGAAQFAVRPPARAGAPETVPSRPSIAAAPGGGLEFPW